MRRVHLLSAAAVLAALLALAGAASADPVQDYGKTANSPYLPKKAVISTKVGPFDCGARPCQYKPKKFDKTIDGPRPGPASIPGKVGPISR
jgi:curli biogenesis system outer membrane secretion channel CsgG